MESEKINDIKKGLECCSNGSCNDCPYDEGETPSPFCINNLAKDSLDYINELESENERLILQYERVKADSEMNCLELKDRIAELENIGLNENITVGEYLREMQRLKDKVAELEKEKTEQLKRFAEKVLKFVKEYAFKDRKEIYTNGTILVPLFRVEYALETGGQDYQQG